jgi:hypothetical protein
VGFQPGKRRECRQERVERAREDNSEDNSEEESARESKLEKGGGRGQVGGPRT